ncbi:mandelate racemase/muconate lactonizing enzyme family protein [Metabacillus arenae]|uniref:Mandelate racemase/muconate lactonizing enzyme family protein n=1 Tax=Metabacillus arenae TaxID=2771434 RepID=A0A926NFR0_9BACI|nr:mandelate racemase/muconate lactonizing enzyme family protein [Metabacillus arenae]MBD1379980.1 mandelate racemase/muconate lactonizing enzyme family protein [Metabacillus arenae]
MRIEKVEIFPLLYKLTKPYGDANGYKKYRTCFLFKITTYSGIHGWGECIDWLPTLEKGFSERIIPYLLGKKATDRTHICGVIKKWHKRAAAGISMALTEIIAKSAGLSVCDLWGGKLRDSIPVYASFQSYSEEEDWLKHSLELIDQAVCRGFKMIKVKIGGRTLQEDQAHIHSVQRLLEEKIGLALDANQSYDAATARIWDRYFREWSNMLWFEEPIPMDQLADYKLLRSNLSIPVAGGENLKTTAQFLPLLKEGAIDIIQPDVMHVNGINEYRETVQLSRSFGVRSSPHSFDGPISRLYSLFVQACLPPWSKMDHEQIEPVEWDVMENPFTSLLSVQPTNGIVKIPDEIGIGAEIDMDKLKKYQWDGTIYH